MRTRRPPRLALAALDRLLPDSSPLAGDLTEEFERGRSRTWIWWQVLAAVLWAGLVASMAAGVALGIAAIAWRRRRDGRSAVPTSWPPPPRRLPPPSRPAA